MVRGGGDFEELTQHDTIKQWNYIADADKNFPYFSLLY
jgi:hypothetical protein